MLRLLEFLFPGRACEIAARHARTRIDRKLGEADAVGAGLLASCARERTTSARTVLVAEVAIAALAERHDAEREPPDPS